MSSGQTTSPELNPRDANPGRAALAQGRTGVTHVPVVLPENASPHPREANRGDRYSHPLPHASQLGI